MAIYRRIAVALLALTVGLRLCSGTAQRRARNRKRSRTWSRKFGTNWCCFPTIRCSTICRFAWKEAK